MDVGSLERNRAKIKKAFTVQDDFSVIANRTLEVHIPKRFVENGFTTLDNHVSSTVVMGIVIPGECYTPLIALADLILAPSGIRDVMINGVPYVILEFEEGDTLFETLHYIQDPNKNYGYFMEFNFYAKLPWYMSDDDFTSLYDHAAAQCGAEMGGTPEHMRVYASLQMRDPDNLDNQYRNSKAMLEGRPAVIVGLNNGAMLIDGTIPKLTGGYLQDNTIAAIVNPDTKVTDLEKILKGVPG